MLVFVRVDETANVGCKCIWTVHGAKNGRQLRWEILTNHSRKNRTLDKRFEYFAQHEGRIPEDTL